MPKKFRGQLDMSRIAILKYASFFFTGICAVAVGRAVIFHKRLDTLARKWVVAIFILSSIGLYAFFVEPNWIEIHKVVVRDSALARVTGNLKIVHITDLHLTHGIGFRERELIKKVNSVHPDIIFITGDFGDDLTQMKPAGELIGQLHARLRIVGVPGNTDQISLDGNSLANTLRPYGIEILVNQATRIFLPEKQKDLWVAGIDENVDGHGNLPRTIESVPPNAPVILLAHSPAIFEEAVRHHMNFVLVGHTHGGQVGIPFLVQLSNYANRTPYMKGLFRKGETQMYVNRGIGTKTLPVRFLCRPEVAVIEVRP